MNPTIQLASDTKFEEYLSHIDQFYAHECDTRGVSVVRGISPFKQSGNKYHYSAGSKKEFVL